MPRKRPKPVDEPFFTNHVDLARRLGAKSSEKTMDNDLDHLQPLDHRDWVEIEEDAFIDARPHLRSYRDSGLRENIPLMTHRIRAKRDEGALSEIEFCGALNDKGNVRESIVDLLTRENAYTRSLVDQSKFSPTELYLFYLKFRWTPADELLTTEYQTAEGVARMVQLVDDCQKIARELRWLVPISDCFESYPMVDEMRRDVLRAAGSKKPQLHNGWLEWFAGWLNEAATRLKRRPGGAVKAKEAAFQITWHDESTARTNGNETVVWEVGRRLFLLTFPTPKARYAFPANYMRTVRRRMKTARSVASLADWTSRVP